MVNREEKFYVFKKEDVDSDRPVRVGEGKSAPGWKPSPPVEE